MPSLFSLTLNCNDNSAQQRPAANPYPVPASCRGGWIPVYLLAGELKDVPVFG